MSVEQRLASLRHAIDLAEAEIGRLRQAYLAAAAVARDASIDRAKTSLGLSCQERKVATLVAKGKTNLEIAAELHVSVNTVKSQVRSILQKLDLNSRWQVAHKLVNDV
jgi:DNA-binding NarL/FixJ family response regulator